MTTKSNTNLVPLLRRVNFFQYGHGLSPMKKNKIFLPSGEILKHDILDETFTFSSRSDSK